MLHPLGIAAARLKNELWGDRSHGPGTQGHFLVKLLTTPSRITYHDTKIFGGSRTRLHEVSAAIETAVPDTWDNLRGAGNTLMAMKNVDMPHVGITRKAHLVVSKLLPNTAEDAAAFDNPRAGGPVEDEAANAAAFLNLGDKDDGIVEIADSLRPYMPCVGDENSANLWRREAVRPAGRQERGG